MDQPNPDLYPADRRSGLQPSQSAPLTSADVRSAAVSGLLFGLLVGVPLVLDSYVLCAPRSCEGWSLILVAPIQWAVAVPICFSKGRRALGWWGVFIFGVAWIGALRIARPRSRWAAKHYEPDSYKQIESRRRFGVPSVLA